jgi:uncharacterized 2Fe-2S/4Fe-4S cluster protein (DUF4445 family)
LIEVPTGTSILGAAQKAGVELNAVCGGTGSCGKCKFSPSNGEFSPHTLIEKELLQSSGMNSEIRLACQTYPLSDCIILFPPESLATLQRLQLEGQNSSIPVDPSVKRIEISNINQYSDEIKKLSSRSRKKLDTLLQNPRNAASLIFNEKGIVSVLAPEEQFYGLAIDLGTTKIAAFLVDLETGISVASAGEANPQIAYGDDVISRIKYCDENPAGLRILHECLVNKIDTLAKKLCHEININLDQITDVVMVGNTAIQHFLLGYPVHSLGTAPYHPYSLAATNIQAQAIGLQLAEGAQIYVPPNVAGFVGSDHLAMIIAVDIEHQKTATVALDIGTNTEISLIHQGKHFSCSCASGPAFEGAHIKFGVRAAPGAIEKVFIENNSVQVHTIQNKPAIGICGSGILDAVAEMRREEILDSRGAFTKTDSKILKKDSGLEYILVAKEQTAINQDISICRKDVNEIQLAKAAIRSGIEILLHQAGISAAEIGRMIIAGAFGTYLDLQNSIEIGMFPSIPIDRFIQVGNAAGAGARQMLISIDERRKAEEMVGRIHYVELTTVVNYTDFFMDAIHL